MRGIPRALMPTLRQALLDCDEFYSPRQLFAVLDVDELKPWQTRLPDANSPAERVDLMISYLSGKYHTNGDNVLCLFLRVLADKYSFPDERHERLNALSQGF